MEKAIDDGYKIEIIRGYKFEKAKIFEGYVDALYKLRQEYPSGHPMNLIAKLLMNSLYGKFGQKSESSVVEIFNKSTAQGDAEFRTFLDTYYIRESVQAILYLDDDEKLVVAVRHGASTSESFDDYQGIDVNVAIGGWIPACSDREGRKCAENKNK